MKKFSVLVSVALLGLFFWYNFTYGQVKIGDIAPAFQLPNVDTKTVAIDDYKDKEGIILVFTCNHCPFSKLYEQRILDLDKKYASKGWPVVAISSNDIVTVPEDSPAEMKALAKKRKYTFPYLYDESQAVAKSYGATRTPHVFLLQSQDHGFTVEYIGAIDDNAKDESAITTRYIEDAITALQNGTKPTTTETKAIGCGIKWKVAATE